MKKYILMVLALVVMCAGTALADTYTFNDSHWGAGSFGTVTVTQSGPNTVHFDVNVDPNYFVNTGNGTNHPVFGFNTISGLSLTMSNLTLTGNGALSLGSAGYTTSDGFGTFQYAILCPTCQGANAYGSTHEFQFDVTGMSLGNLLVDDQGYLFVADIFSRTNGGTGLIASNGQTPPVPEPGSLMLLGSGLLGAGGFLRRRFFK